MSAYLIPFFATSAIAIGVIGYNFFKRLGSNKGRNDSSGFKSDGKAKDDSSISGNRF